MAATARAQGFPEFADWFDRLARAERNHAERFRRGIEAVQRLDRDSSGG